MTFLKALPVLLITTSLCSQAAIQPDRTRIIFNSTDKASSLKLENQSKRQPYLAYSWIEDEQGKKSEDYLVALPPMQRLEPTALSQVRIVRQDKTRTLPADRESLFYFNVREIPPAPENSGNNAIVQMAVQSRLKIFWRPAALKKKPGVEVEKNITAQQQGSSIQIHNPTGYYITLAYFGKDKKGVFPGFSSVMIAPFASATLNAHAYTGSAFDLGYMDDYGGLRMLHLQCQGNCRISVPEDKK